MTSRSRSPTTTSTTSDASSNAIDDRLRALLEEASDDESLPEIQGVELIDRGVDAGLYQITVRGYDGTPISLGRSKWLEKASEIHDMVAIGLHGGNSALNFAPQRYTAEGYINVLLNFQKLFPGNHFWTAIQRGIDAGVKYDPTATNAHPVLRTFFGLSRSDTSYNQTDPVAKWPPFCPAWILAKSKGNTSSTLIYDASANLHQTDMNETFSIEGKKRDRGGRIYQVPRNGIVTHRVTDPFVPPATVIDSRVSDSDVARKTRRGRSVKQPMRYREDTHLCLSDSDSPANGGDGSGGIETTSLHATFKTSSEVDPSKALITTVSCTSIPTIPLHPSFTQSNTFRPLRLQSLDTSHHT